MIGQIALECMIISLKWSLQNIEDFELKKEESSPHAEDPAGL